MHGMEIQGMAWHAKVSHDMDRQGKARDGMTSQGMVWKFKEGHVKE
jgi:hypothetical protein